MRKYIIKLLIFLGIILCLFASIFFINKKISRPTAYKLNGSNLILGDSNSQCAFNDSILIGYTNYSDSSDSYFYSYLKLKYLLEEGNNIDTVYLSFAPHNIFENGWLLDDEHLYTRFRKYYSLMGTEDFKYLILSNSEGVLKASVRIITGIVKNLKKKYKGEEIKLIGGFLGINRNIWEEDIQKLKRNEPLDFFDIPKNHEIAQCEIDYLEHIIKICRDNKIQLCLVNSPKRKELLDYEPYGYKEFYDYYDRNLSDIVFYDFSEISMPDNYYGDLVHLNKKGAEYFSKYFIKKITIINNAKEYRYK